jgi:hypothetical protein
MSRRASHRFNYFVGILVVVAIFAAAVAFLISRYPWQIYHSDFSSAKNSLFTVNWPMPSLEEERQDRKKLKRFPKSEQMRRLGIVLRRMDFLNVPIYDFFLDQGVQVFSPEVPLGTNQSVPLIWPSLGSRRRIGSEDSSLKDLRYIVLPYSYGAQCVEGIHLATGDEVRIVLPQAQAKRNVSFSILPLTPSSVRAWLGQFSWAKQFTDLDVNKFQSISIPINDPATSNLRLSVGSGQALLISASISQWERVGRIPVQVGVQSRLWRSAEEISAPHRQDEVEGHDEYSTEENPSINAQQSQGFSQSTVDNNRTSVESLSATAKSSTTASPSAGISSHLKDNSGTSSKGLAKTKQTDIAATLDLLDPEQVKFNSVVPVPGSKSVALGYNVLLIQLDSSLTDLFSDNQALEAISPRLHSLFRTSLSFPVRFPSPLTAQELFQHTIVRQNGELVPVNIPILTRNILGGQNVFNLYQEFRNYGYKVASFAPSSALSMPNVLSRVSGFSKVEGRWLDNNDWKFQLRRKELDQQNEPVTGLEAIFKNEQNSAIDAVTENDFLKMSELLRGLERENQSVPDWKANEISIIGDSQNYMPKLVDSFQKWVKTNAQTRFMTHVYLNSDDSSLRPSFKDFIQVFKKQKLKAFVFPGNTQKLSQIAMMDRVFGLLLDTLVARRLHHRTVIGVMIPPQFHQRDYQDGRFLISVPGLVPKKREELTHVSFDDLLTTLAQSVGVDLNQFDAQGQRIFRGVSLEGETEFPDMGELKVDAKANAVPHQTDRSPKAVSEGSSSVSDSSAEHVSLSSNLSERRPELTTQQVALANHVSRFRMIVLPRASGCQPFEWLTTSNYFGLEASQPIVEEPNPSGRIIRVYPCGLQDQVMEISWFQSHSDVSQAIESSVNLPFLLGGSFRLMNAKGAPENTDAPMFLIGPQALSIDSLPLKLQKFSRHEVSRLFDLEVKMQPGRETVARALNWSVQIQNPEMSSRTLVYIFREPVRR